MRIFSSQCSGVADRQEKYLRQERKEGVRNQASAAGLWDARTRIEAEQKEFYFKMMGGTGMAEPEITGVSRGRSSGQTEAGGLHHWKVVSDKERYWGLANTGREGKVRVFLYKAALREVKLLAFGGWGGGG